MNKGSIPFLRAKFKFKTMATLLIIYLIGFALSFFRARASFLELSNKTKFKLDKQTKIAIWVIGALSWFGFLSGIYFYFTENEKRFF